MVAALNIHKRFILQFFIQLVLVFILFFFTLMAVWAFTGFSIMDHEATQDLSKMDSESISDKVSIKGKKVTFDEELTKLAANQDGWFLVLTKKGEVIGSFNAPEQAPAHFTESEMASLLLQKDAAETTYAHWSLDNGVLLFGKENIEISLLNDVKEGAAWQNQQLNLSEAAVQQFKENKAWVQLISYTGEVVDGYGKGEKSDAYSIQDLQTLAKSKDDSVAAYFDEETKQVLLVGVNPSSSMTKLQESLIDTISNGFIVIFVMVILMLIFGTFWYANKFGVPLLTLMKWIQNLGAGKYEQPLDLHQRPIMLNKKGKLKRKYRLYKDLIKTLSHLTETLHQNETDRKKMTQTREEWISGLSHDLKTPLSSIAGYAQMLESEDYVWTKTETREFAGTIAEKSTYMMELLEDLMLSYRLKNQALPIAKEAVDINEFIRRTIIHFINDPANNDKEFIFRPHDETVIASIDHKWFQRVIDNLLANAVKYNPAGTKIIVTISLIEQHLMTITIEDDGIGMDKETLDKLFQRYYRGTNTSESSNGTGLGMAITKQLIQLHGGSINVKSAPQKGTIVRLIFPI